MRIKNTIFSLKHPKRYDVALLFAVLVLVLFGTVMIIVTNVGKTASEPLAVPKAMIKQVLFACFSYCVMVFLAHNFTMQRLNRFYIPIGIFLLILLLMTQMFAEVYGSKAWIRIPIAGMQITIQPSEFAKVYMICLVGLFVERCGKHRHELWQIIKVPICIFLAMLAAILLQRDLGSCGVLCLITMVCAFIPSNITFRKAQNYLKVFFFVALLVFLLGISGTGIKILSSIPMVDHIATRIENTLNPFNDPYGKGYQPINGLYGIARGGLKGQGFGESIQKYGYLTQSDNDYILSIVIEELGFSGLVVVVAFYILIIQRLFYYAFRTKSEGFKVILVGTASYIFIHFALNVGGIIGLIPLTGVPLLFISSGSSSLISIMSAIGICQSIISRIRKQGADHKIVVQKKRTLLASRVQ